MYKMISCFVLAEIFGINDLHKVFLQDQLIMQIIYAKSFSKNKTTDHLVHDRSILWVLGSCPDIFWFTDNVGTHIVCFNIQRIANLGPVMDNVQFL